MGDFEEVVVDEDGDGGAPEEAEGAVVDGAGTEGVEVRGHFGVVWEVCSRGV